MAIIASWINELRQFDRVFVTLVLFNNVSGKSFRVDKKFLASQYTAARRNQEVTATINSINNPTDFDDDDSEREQLLNALFRLIRRKPAFRNKLIEALQEWQP